MSLPAYKDPAHPGNGLKYRTKRKCIESGCPNPAGTAWSKLWCFKHNVERMDRINAQFEKVRAAFSREEGSDGR